jgi:hypothetical protein
MTAVFDCLVTSIEAQNPGGIGSVARMTGDPVDGLGVCRVNQNLFDFPFRDSMLGDVRYVCLMIDEKVHVDGSPDPFNRPTWTKWIQSSRVRHSIPSVTSTFLKSAPPRHALRTVSRRTGTLISKARRNARVPLLPSCAAPIPSGRFRQGAIPSAARKVAASSMNCTPVMVPPSDLISVTFPGSRGSMAVSSASRPSNMG